MITERKQELHLKRGTLLVDLSNLGIEYKFCLERHDVASVKRLRESITEKARMLTEVVAELAKELEVMEDRRDALS